MLIVGITVPALGVIEKEAKEKLKETYTDAEIGNAIEEILKKTCRAKILRTQKHVDGRDIKQIRKLTAEVALLPRTHGSGLFSRGQTQVLAITTLGSLGQAKTVDDALKINQQLSDIEGQIEQIQGKINYLSTRSAFSTRAGLRVAPMPT